MKDLNSMKVPELKALAKEKGLKGSDSMKKDELLAALENKAAQNHKPNEYHDHMAQYESKEERKAKESSSMPADYLNHPKFAKFKKSSGSAQHD